MPTGGSSSSLNIIPACGRNYDVTGLRLDLECLMALPESLREEVLRQQNAPMVSHNSNSVETHVAGSNEMGNAAPPPYEEHSHASRPNPQNALYKPLS